MSRLDDGLDVDEAGAGSLIGRLVQVTANVNAERTGSRTDLRPRGADEPT